MTRIDRHQRWLWLGLIAWCGLLIMLNYSATLRWPLITDDWVQLPYASSRTVQEIWQGAKGPTYYRPLAFTLWKVLYLMLGRHDEVILHALNLVLYFASALMVGWLTGRLWPSAQGAHRTDWLRRYLSTGLFVLFPFSYDAIAWIAAVMHPLVVTLILLSVVSYVKARETRSPWWTALGLITVFLSPFVHENGVLAGPLIMAVELTWPPSEAQPLEPLWRRISRAALWLIPAVFWWLIWRSIPIERGAESLALNTAKTLWRNSAYFLQGPAYPLTWPGGVISEGLAIDNTVVAVSLAAMALVGAALVQWRTGADRRAWLPWLWIGLSSAPTVLFLRYTYVSSSPRMMLLMSIGAAWLWADVAVRVLDWGQATRIRRRITRALVGVLMVALMVQNVMFVHDRLRPWELGGTVIRQIVAQASLAYAQGQQAVFINLPSWIASERVGFAIGQNGAGFLSTYYPLEVIVRSYTDQAGRAASLRDDAIRTETPTYYVGLRDSTTDWPSLAQTRSQLFITRYLTDAIELQAAGALNVPAPDSPALAQFDGALTLLAAEARPTENGLHIELVWRSDAAVPPDVTAFVHVVDANGQVIAQADGDPLANTYSFAQWPRGLIVQDIRMVEVKDAAAVRVGLYNRSTDQRLTTLTPAGLTLPDNAVTIPLEEVR